MNVNNYSAREGDIYEVLYVDGGAFEIRYGYYEDYERGDSEPIPIYPDLEKTPIYGAGGKRIVTFMQAPCEHYEARVGDAERCCGCCKYYPENKQMINACECKQNKIEKNSERSNEI